MGLPPARSSVRESSHERDPTTLARSCGIWHWQAVQRHVLVVDDEPEFLELMAHGLAANGFRCSVASDGMGGLDSARRLKPDAVLLDVMLPDLDGFTICEMLRRHPATGSIPVLMLTCLDGSLCRMNGLSAGAADYLVKPFKIGELVTRLHAVIDRKPRRADPAAGATFG